ncbi:MAG TPA: metallophosphoesterase [bacterium]|jgi:3',5'-cyclic AMP phosphodiesterase CpdA
MLQLAHISDLHYTEANRARVAALFDVVRRAGIDHLIVTGDLTADAREEHLIQVRDLLFASGFRTSAQLTVIPGNHDIFGFIYQTYSKPNAVVKVRTRRDLLNTIRTLWHFRRRLLAYNDAAYQQDVAAFRAHFVEAYENCLTMRQSPGGFPFVKLLPDNIALIGLDTNHLMPRSYNLLRILRGSRSAMKTWDLTPIGDNLSGSTGFLDFATTKAALEMPQIEGRRKIVVMHHYLYPLPHVEDLTSGVFAREMQLRNREEISALFISHGVDLILHGHWHIDDAYQLDGALGPKVLNGGGSLWSGFNRIEAGERGLQFKVGMRN